MKIYWLIPFLILSCDKAVNRNPPSNSKIDSLIISQMKERQIPGIEVGVLKDGKIIYQNTFGYSVLEHQIPVKLETTFELASLTKQFVSAGILLLVQEGKVALDNPVKHYIDSLPSFWQELTLRRLLSHTAGLKSQKNEYSLLRPWPKYVSKEMMWKAAIHDSVASKPGERFSYHNTGYFLAEVVIENVSGKDYKSFFRERVFDHLDMQNTYFENQVQVVDNSAQGYTLKNGEWIKIWRVSQEEMAGGWGIWSTLEDLIKWNNALDRNELLKPEFQQEMFKPITLENNRTFHYGLGWFLPVRNGLPYQYHNGIAGPEILKIPKYNFTVITLSNLGIGNGVLVGNEEADPYGVAEAIASELIPSFRFNPQPVPMTEQELKKLEGNFSFGYDQNVTFSTRNGRLLIKDKYGEDEMINIGNMKFTFQDAPPIYYKFVNQDEVELTEEVWESDFGKRINL